MSSSNRQRGLSLMLVFIAVILILFANRLPDVQDSITSSPVISKDIRDPQLDFAGIKVQVPFGRRDDSITINHAISHLAKKRKANKVVKRALTWEQALLTGQEYVDRLNGERQQSRWSTTEQLVEKGWEIVTPAEEQPDFYADIYPDLEGNIQRSDATQLEALQDKEYSNCRYKNLPGTHALFDNEYNVPGRTIIGLSNFSPSYFLRASRLPNDPIPLEEKLPDVYSWSDVIWVNWPKLAGGSGGSLKYVFKHDCTTADTVTIIKYLLGVSSDSDSNSGSESGSDSGSDSGSESGSESSSDSDPIEPIGWPGLKFFKGTQGFQGLLGTPHGKGIVWLIVQHPDEMPGKSIESINIFTTENDGKVVYNLLFTLSG